jgi:DNA polymerase elongation subunit (family B)
MKIPLSVQSVEINGKEYLNIWCNGKNILLPSPIKPYFYSLEKLNIPATISKVEAIAISDYTKKTFYKYEFDTRKELTKYRNEKTFEDSIPFVLRHRIDNPDLYTKYPHHNIKFNYLDIEQWCPDNKLFPTYEDRMLAISFASNDRKIKTIYLKKENNTDKQLLEKYKELYPKPDVDVLYNKDYDLPVILERCKRNGIGTGFLSKDGTQPFIGGKHGIQREGTITYDILESTRRDQSLSGNVPNKGLKTVSNYFGYKGVELDTSEISKYVGTRELIEYNKEDVKRLFFLFDIYWEGIEYTSNDLKIPLNLAVDLNVNDLGIIVLGDLYREHNIICDGNNYDRYPEIFQRKKNFGEGNYQGALVFIKKRGLFKPVIKVDYSSMYPTIAAEFNFSPDTCKIIQYLPYKKNGFKIEEDDKTFIYYIPDSVLKKTVVVRTLKHKKGFLSEAIKRFLDERDKYKKEYKRTGSKIARARSDIAKVKANGGIYGNMGSPHSAFGFAPIAVATCGIGRECAKLLIDVLESLYPDSVTECDTDGIFISTEEYNEERILYYFNEALEKKFKKKLNLNIDIDTYDCGFFHKAKNYILKKGNNIILHGVALKASSKDPLSKNLINDLARAKLEGKSTDTIVQYYKSNMKNLPLKDFAMQVSMGMNIHEYKNPGCLSVQMATKAQRNFGLRPVKGNSYHYVKCVYGYELYQMAEKDQLDFNYYTKKIDKIIKMLESEYEMFAKIGDFIDGKGSWKEETESKNMINLNEYL